MNAIKNNFYVIIPARIDSTRLPRKMLLDIAGIPLVVRTAMIAKQSSAKHVLVATDSVEIAQMCSRYNIESFITSRTHPSGSFRISEVVESLKIDDDVNIINLQGDEPLMPASIIDSLNQFMLDNCRLSATEIATVACRVPYNYTDILNASTVKVVVDKFNHAMYFSRSIIPFGVDVDKIALVSQQANSSCNANFAHDAHAKHSCNQSFTYLRHLGIYGYKARFIKNIHTLDQVDIEIYESLEQLRMLYNGHKIKVLQIDDIATCSIDTAADVEKCHAMLNAHSTHQ